MKFHFTLKRFHFIFIFLFFLLTLCSNKIFELEWIINFKKLPDVKKVALTFDDGPHPYYTEKIAEIIKKHDVKATFFFVGKQVEKYPEILKTISKNPNCKVGNHSFSHRNILKLKEKDLYYEIYNTQNLLLKIAENKESILNYFRPPGGNYNEALLEVLDSLGMKLALWSVFTNDHCCRLTKKQLLNTIEKFCIDKNEIILLHSGSQITLEALEDIIKLLKRKGYTFVFINEIYEKKDIGS